jgi:hypothetical protein
LKTTIDIPELLYKKAKICAIERGQSLKQVVLSALENNLAEPATITRKVPYFARRKISPEFARLQARSAFRRKPGDRDITELISEDREDRSL